MKYVRQFVIIMFLSFLGEILKAVIPLPIPSSIYGLVLMLLVLKMGIVKLEDVKDAGNLFIDIMPLMFIPAAVGLLDAWSDIKGILFPVAVIIFITTVLVMAVTGRVTMMAARKEKGENEGFLWRFFVFRNCDQRTRI